MKNLVIFLIVFLGTVFKIQAFPYKNGGDGFYSDRGVIEITKIKKFKSRNPEKSLYKFSGRILIGGNECLADGVNVKFRRNFENGVDHFWVQKDLPPDLDERFCTKEFKPVYRYFTQRIVSKKLILFNVLNRGKVDADRLVKNFSNKDTFERD
jgi:hypothetical protein